MELEGLTALDETTFRRVWERVMPDQSLSPIVVTGGGAVAPVHSRQADVAMLEEMMDDLRQWQSRLEKLSRNSGSKTTALRALVAGERRQIRRLATLYYLWTGSQYIPRTSKLPMGQSLVETLRQGFLQQMGWAKQCAQLAEALEETGLRELAGEIGEGCLEQGRQLRTLVETSLPQGRR